MIPIHRSPVRDAHPTQGSCVISGIDHGTPRNRVHRQALAPPRLANPSHWAAGRHRADRHLTDQRTPRSQSQAWVLLGQRGRRCPRDSRCLSRPRLRLRHLSLPRHLPTVHQRRSRRLPSSALQPLTAPLVSPETIHFWNTRKRMKTGIAPSVAAAIASPHRTSP